MTMRLHAGTVDVVLRYTLTPGDGLTRVRRVVTVGIPWSLKLAQPVLVRAFRTESSRALLGSRPTPIRCPVRDPRGAACAQTLAGP
jgi:hypothetical protein